RDIAAGLGAWKEEDLIAYLGTGRGTGHGTAAGPMGEAVDNGLRWMAPEDIRALVAYVRTVPAITSSDGSAELAPAAPESHRAGGIDDPRGKQIFEGACVSCHSWTGVSPITPFATLTGARAVNDAHAINIVQAVISGVERHTPDGVAFMPS